MTESSVLRSASAYILVYDTIYVRYLGIVYFLVQILALEPPYAALISFVCFTFPRFIVLDKPVYRFPKAVN